MNNTTTTVSERTEIQESIQHEIQLVERALRGEVVNGVKLGDAGITKDWLESHLNSLKRMAVGA